VAEEMTAYDIMIEIEALEEIIAELVTQRTKLEKLNKDISTAKKFLSTALTMAGDALEQLKLGYQSDSTAADSAINKQKELEDTKTTMDVNSKLDTVLIESNIAIEKINAEIKSKETRITELRKILQGIP